MNNPMPTCPYCGAEMEPRNISHYYYTCPICYACSPVLSEYKSARAAAMQRYREPNRVLTLNELAEMEDCHSIYFETTGLGWDCGSVFESSVACAKETFCDEDEGEDAKKEYGVKVRCWLRRPTGEERQNTPWEAPPC